MGGGMPRGLSAVSLTSAAEPAFPFLFFALDCASAVAPARIAGDIPISDRSLRRFMPMVAPLFLALRPIVHHRRPPKNPARTKRATAADHADLAYIHLSIETLTRYVRFPT